MQHSPDTTTQGKADSMLIAARIFFALAFVPIAVMAYGSIREDAVLKVAGWFSYLGWSSVGLGMIAGIFYGIYEFKRLRKNTGDQT